MGSPGGAAVPLEKQRRVWIAESVNAAGPRTHLTREGADRHAAQLGRLETCHAHMCLGMWIGVWRETCVGVLLDLM